MFCARRIRSDLRDDCRDDGFFQSAVDIRDPQNLSGRAEKFDVVVGSGRHGQTYLYWKGDELFELPVSYWTYSHEWINSPGYVDGEVNFDRLVEPRCIECHMTRFDSMAPWPATPTAGVSGTPAPPRNRYRRDSLVLGIGCERCHGPGSEHVEREQGSERLQPLVRTEIAIVNPARLVRERQLDLCALCHAGPGEPTAPALSFQAGDDIAGYLKITAPPANAPVDVHGNQVGALKASKCYLSGKLTCSTCHNVHRIQESADSFSGRCLTCHEVHACGRFKQTGGEHPRQVRRVPHADRKIAGDHLGYERRLAAGRNADASHCHLSKGGNSEVVNGRQDPRMVVKPCNPK